MVLVINTEKQFQNALESCGYTVTWPHSKEMHWIMSVQGDMLTAYA